MQKNSLEAFNFGNEKKKIQHVYVAVDATYNHVVNLMDIFPLETLCSTFVNIYLIFVVLKSVYS